MSLHGQYNYKGINAQSWAAISLFLQYLKDPNLSHIHLEAKHFEDFNLVFNDGHKIICESKDHKRKVSYFLLKNILNNLVGRGSAGANDEILVICRNYDENMETMIRHMKYHYEYSVSEFQKKGFVKEEIELLAKVKFWAVNPTTNKAIVYSLFRELCNFWIPEDEIEKNVHNILIKKIYEGSQNGDIYKRTDILAEIEGLRNSFISDSGYMSKKVLIETRLKSILDAIDDPSSPIWSKSQIKAIAADNNIMSFLVEALKKKNIDDLSKWASLWGICNRRWFVFALFDIFLKNMENKGNRGYILKFILGMINPSRGFYYEDYFEDHIIRALKKVQNIDKDNLIVSFEIIKKILDYKRDNYFYLKTTRDRSYIRDSMCNLLRDIYYSADTKLKQKIIQYVVEKYNLVEDDGEHSHYTPIYIYDILKNYILSDTKYFIKRMLWLNDNLVAQFNKVYKRFSKKTHFNGWEYIGGITTGWDDELSIKDRYFIRYILKPALNEYYKTNQKDAWWFIDEYCVSNESQVNKKRPDYLNRACIDILLQSYVSSGDKDIEKKALKIMREFILSKRGIPHKADLIYQEILARHSNISAEKKWDIAQIGIEAYNVPVSNFLEKLVLNMAIAKHQGALDVLKKWMDNAQYRTVGRFGSNFVGVMNSLLDAEFIAGVKVFQEFIGDDYFKEKCEDFSVYEIVGTLNKIIRKDFEVGLSILERIKKQKELTNNEQILLWRSYLPLGEVKDDAEYLDKIYERFVDPFLNEQDNNIDNINKKIKNSHLRSSFVEFAERIANSTVADKIGKILRIIRVFINDPDPYITDKDPSDTKNEYNEHKHIEDGKKPALIRSVRGWCAWTLTYCAVLDGRKYINEIVDMTEKLVKDRNYYIKHMSCRPLSQLVRIRLSIMPDDKDKLLLNDNKVDALKMAKRIETIAFESLNDLIIKPDKVKTALHESVISVFNNLRALNEEGAIKFVKAIRAVSDEATAHALPLLIYFAEFRKYAFIDWKFKEKGLYDDLSPDKYDDGKFKHVIKDLIINGSKEIRGAIAWNFWVLPREKDEKINEDHLPLSFRYFDLLIQQKRYEYNVFEYIYYFINDYLEINPKGCINLWQQCIDIEKSYVEKNFKDFEGWRINYYNGKVLIKIKEVYGDKIFFQWVQTLFDYPEGIGVGDMNEVISILKAYPKDNEDVEKLFAALVSKRGAIYFNAEQEWKNQ